MRLQLMQSLASRFYTAPQSGSSCLVLWQIPGGSRADDDLCCSDSTTATRKAQQIVE